MALQTRTIVFLRRLPSGTVYRLGVAIGRADHWRFIPNVFGRRASRKAHPTMERCIPRWVRYPSGCETIEETK